MTRRVRVYVRGAIVPCALNEILQSRLIAPPRPRRRGPLLARLRSRESSQAPLNEHFDFAVHRLRDEVEHLRVKPVWVDTEHQTGDIFTKALDEKAFLRHRDTFYK